MSNFARTTILIGTSSLAGLVGCYTAEFDETKPDVYFCASDDDCLENQKCGQSVCLDDTGPSVLILGPEAEPIEEFTNVTSIDVQLDVRDLVLEESDAVVEGQGRVLLSIDPHWGDPLTAVLDAETGVFDFGGVALQHGAHRLVAQAVYGDHTPYANPSARTSNVFFASDGTQRPQVGMVHPSPGHIHVLGEPLTVQVVTYRYQLVQNSATCHAPQDCDPFTAEPETCVPTEMDGPCGALSDVGHTHLYLLEDYPDCLMDTPVNCNAEYIASVKPEQDVALDNVTKVIEPDILSDVEPGEYTLTAALQYSDHAPFPNVANVIYDQMPITIVAP